MAYSRVLYVGDPHARPEDLDDCEALIDLVEDTAREYMVDRIVFLGDQHHTHAIMHVEVLGFWRRALKRLTDIRYETIDDLGDAAKPKVYLMLGNHDQPGDASSKSHALLAYKDMPGVVVLDEPVVIDDILYLPYMHSREAFVEACRAHPTKVVVCHQTFDGAKYENGFFAKDGVNPADIPQQCVISGHIHDPQSFGKVSYLGSPRWLSVSDANGKRFLHVIEHDLDDYGFPGGVKYIPTDTHLRKLHLLIDTPDQPLNVVLNSRHRYQIDVQGPAEWIEQRRPLYTGKARVRTQRTDRAMARVRESEGIDAALKRFISTYKAPRGTDTATLEKVANARLRA